MLQHDIEASDMQGDTGEHSFSLSVLDCKTRWRLLLNVLLLDVQTPPSVKKDQI